MASGPRRGIYIGLGANLGDPRRQLAQALSALASDVDIVVRRASSAYETPPWGNTAQPPFVNAVAELASTLPTEAIVTRLLAVERALGRARDPSAPQWSPRLIDLDLLVDGDARVDAPGCTVPHPRLAQRAFVLVPLAELDAGLAIPGVGTVAQCLSRLPADERAGARRLGALEWQAHIGE